MGYGALSSASTLQVLAGANLAAIQTPAGDWEILQFATATLIAPSTYNLTGLLRGQAGSDATMANMVPVGQPFVVLNNAISQVPLSAAQTGLPLNWRYGPSSRSIGDATYATSSHTFTAAGLRPLSPVRIKGQRAANGDLTVSWIRRTRIGGDSWDLPDVPLSEDAERYEAVIVSGQSVKRTIPTTQPTFTYTAADQTIDFGSPVNAITVRIAQVSGTYGRGAAATASV